MKYIHLVDPAIATIIGKEERRQLEGIELIASENYASAAVCEAQSSFLTNKYAEGLPGKRYYGGCEFVDEAEQLAIDRAKQLFGAEHVNVQPHSGAQANAAAYLALANPGDTMLGLSLDQGGHLTHGMKINFSGKYYHFVSYGVTKEEELIDYDEVQQLAEQYRPKVIVTGASAYPRIFDFPRMRQIADSVGAYLLVDMAHIAGLIAARVHPSPFGYAHVVTTTTHKTLRGPRGALIFSTAELAAKIDKAVFPGIQGGPLMHIIAAKAVALQEALQPEFVTYQKQVIANAQVLAQRLKDLGFRLVSGGTDTHLALVDVSPLQVNGQQVETALEAVNISANKNKIPHDPLPAMKTSGIRLGTPAITTRGFKEAEMLQVADFIHRVVTNLEHAQVQQEVRNQVKALCERFPLPGIFLATEPIIQR